MSLTLPQTCNMGSSKTGLVGTIGVTLLNPDGTTKTARATAGIYEIGGGTYGKEIVFDDNWSGVIVWDTGGGTPYYATVEYNVEGMADSIIEDTNELQGDWVDGGRLDVILDARASQASVDAVGGIVSSILEDTGTTLETHLTDIKGTAFVKDTDSLPQCLTATSVTVSDKTGFSLSTAGIAAIWNALTSGMSTVGSIGKKLADWVVGTIDTYTGNTKQTADHTAALTTAQSDLTYMIKVIKNKKELVKTLDVWQLIIYDDDNTTPILRKDLKDINGDNISDFVAGILAKELKTDV